MELQKACEDVVGEVDDAMACAIVDLENGLVLGEATRPGVAGQVVNQAVRLAGTMFRGRLTGQFVRALPSGARLPGYVQEAQVTTDHCKHFLSAVPGWPDALVVLVTDQSMSIGLGWMALHQALTRFDRGGSVERAGPLRTDRQATAPPPASPSEGAAPAAASAPSLAPPAGAAPAVEPRIGPDTAHPPAEEETRTHADEQPGAAAARPGTATVRRMGARAFVKAKEP